MQPGEQASFQSLPKRSAQAWLLHTGASIQFGKTTSEAPSKALLDTLINLRGTLNNTLNDTQNTAKRQELEAAVSQALENPAIDFNFCNYNGSLLGLACEMNRLDLLEMMLQKGGDINQQFSRGSARNVLASAMSSRYIDLPQKLTLLEKLVGLGADINMGDQSASPLHYGIQTRQPLALIEKLLDLGANVNGPQTNPSRSPSPPIHLAFSQNNLPLIELLYQRGADLNQRDNSKLTLLHVAINQPPELVDWLLSKNVDVDPVDALGISPFHIALSSNNLPLAQKLVRLGANLNRTNKMGLHPLALATANNTPEPLHWVMNHPDLKPPTPKEVTKALAGCIENNNSSHFQEILNRYPADLDLPVANLDPMGLSLAGGLTLLEIACSNPSAFWAIEPLLKAGANPNRKNPLLKGLTALEFIVGNTPGERYSRDVDELLALFLDAGFNPNTLTSTGVPLLFVAACKSSPSLIEKFLEKGADPTILDSDGNNICLFAAKMGCHDVVDTWARKGIDPNATNRFQATAKDLALGNQIHLMGNRANAFIEDGQFLKDMEANYKDTLFALDRYGVTTSNQGVERVLQEIRRYQMKAMGLEGSIMAFGDILGGFMFDEGDLPMGI